MLLALLLLLAASGCGEAPPESQLVGEGPEALVALAVEVDAPEADDSLGVARATFQTDTRGGVWYDALAAPGDDPAMGLTVDGQTRLHGWTWWSDADSVALGPADRIRGVARPDVAVRSYLERDTSGFVQRVLAQIQGERPARLSERVTLLDAPADTASGTAALLVEIADEAGTVGFRPVRSDRETAGEYRVEETGGALVFAAARDVPTDTLTVPEGPIWTAVVARDGAVRSTSAAAETPEAGRDAAFRLGEVAVATPGAVVVATGPTPEAAAATARRALADAEARREARSARMAAFVEDLGFETEDETANMAFRWAALSLDALVREDSSRVTLAPGLPGAEPASFPSALWTLGAFLDLGQWERARNLLTTFGDAQRFDRRIDLLGRAPDLVPRGGDPVFATADGTLVFLDAAGDYVRTTGDRGLVTGGEDFWFKTVFALRGVFEPDGRNGSAMDSTGLFLARAQRGTWLEADPERGGVRRRGAPAEAQGALHQALGTATQFARIMGVAQRSSASWYADTSAVLLDQFRQRFARGEGVADRLGDGPEADGPGGLLALALLDGLPASERARLAQAEAARLAFPYGVASRPQTDSLFHPFLDKPAFYRPEAARTGGAVWTWLAGPTATLLAETGGAAPAAKLMATQAAFLLDAGVVGALPELVDGHPRADGVLPGVGGAPVQPWSLAGYVRGTIEGLVGATYPSADTLVVAPRLPEAWGTTRVRMRMGEGHVGLTLAGAADGIEAEVVPEGRLPQGATLVVEAAGQRVAVPLVQTQGDSLAVAREAFSVEVSAGGARLGDEALASEALPALPDWSGFAFATPDLR
ncbi:MAG: amylo-alpha-1,6-glucosidase, partial [Bacteroidota bacterium]